VAEVVKGETNGEPMVSVLITVYNREKYVATAIESVLAQTYRNFELIITDDCSRDPSLQIAQRYQADRRVKVYRNERNLGDYANRNRAASLAKGKYLKYVDADDLIYPHCLETMVHAMEMFPQAGFGISSSVPGVLSPAMLSPRETYLYDYGGGGLLDAGPLSTIVRRADFEAIGRFNEARHTSDGLCWLTMARRHGWPSSLRDFTGGVSMTSRRVSSRSVVLQLSPRCPADDSALPWRRSGQRIVR